jgi:hypothetical protein
VVEQPLTGSEPAVVVVDLAPLRLLDCSEVRPAGKHDVLETMNLNNHT